MVRVFHGLELDCEFGAFFRWFGAGTLPFGSNKPYFGAVTPCFSSTRKYFGAVFLI